MLWPTTYCLTDRWRSDSQQRTGHLSVTIATDKCSGHQAGPRELRRVRTLDPDARAPPGTPYRGARRRGPESAATRDNGSAADQLPEHELQDPAVAVVVRLTWGVDPDDGVEPDRRAVRPGGRDGHRARRGAGVQL